MHISPNSLQDLCLDTFCDHIEIYIKQINCLNYKISEIGSANERNYTGKMYKFKDKDLFLFKEISEKLLEKLCEKRLLCDELMFLFDENNTKLERVRLNNTKLTFIGLQMMKKHKVIKLECLNLRTTSISEILDSLSNWSLQNITSVNFSKCSFIDMQRHSLMVKIVNLKQLRSLNLSQTELNQTTFEMICEDLQQLEHLNVSGTSINDIEPLRRLAHKLQSLVISDLSQAKNYSETIALLHNLKHLDMSLFNQKPDTQIHNTNVTEHLPNPINEILKNENILLNLQSLDISGWRNSVSLTHLEYFIKSHPKLRFLGMVIQQVFVEQTFIDQRPGLIVAGLANYIQIKYILKIYKDRASYIQKALYQLFQYTSQHLDSTPGMFELVLPVMSHHANKFGVQMAATACLYNLSRGEVSKRIHPSILRVGVNLTLNAMDTFSDEFQLQKNALLTLCNDSILQDINFDRFRCAKLVLNALCAFEDTNTNRMSIAICSILASKVSTEETSKLGAQPDYMKKLLSIVQDRVDRELLDITLKFTLSALWNLTDESSATCSVFLQQDGANLFLNVLQTFCYCTMTQTKVLGLMNNIAEVRDLRSALMLDELILELYKLLKNENIDVSYFAAGIVAHLASDGEIEWTVRSHGREEMLNKLGEAVNGWKVPDSEMVAYRSFRPFFTLLNCNMDYQVQLWAVWAIHHVCTKNPKRYCLMLQEEKGNLLLAELSKDPRTNREIRGISEQILKELKLMK